MNTHSELAYRRPGWLTSLRVPLVQFVWTKKGNYKSLKKLVWLDTSKKKIAIIRNESGSEAAVWQVLQNFDETDIKAPFVYVGRGWRAPFQSTQTLVFQIHDYPPSVRAWVRLQIYLGSCHVTATLIKICISGQCSITHIWSLFTCESSQMISPSWFYRDSLWLGIELKVMQPVILLVMI